MELYSLTVDRSSATNLCHPCSLTLDGEYTEFASSTNTAYWAVVFGAVDCASGVPQNRLNWGLHTSTRGSEERRVHRTLGGRRPGSPWFLGASRGAFFVEGTFPMLPRAEARLGEGAVRTLCQLNRSRFMIAFPPPAWTQVS
jgi:hypothetical protein